MLSIRDQWTFEAGDVAEDFDRHVREQLPWYEIATRMVAHIARHYLPSNGTVIDVGASTGNIGRALSQTLEARNASLIAIEAAKEMAAKYNAPGQLIIESAESFKFSAKQPDVIICFLTLMFVPVAKRTWLLNEMKASLRPGGALIVFDKMVAGNGYLSTMLYRLTLIAKQEAGAAPGEIMAKDLSLAGIQRPLSERELQGFAPVFRFGDFAGFVFEKEAG
jgi:tRNA (cmo5U34)-methyltransferase